jgi:MFS family permease
MGNTGMSILVQFLTLNQWGRISDVFGNRRILGTTGVLVPLMPLLWIFSTNYWYLLCAQALSGLAWAGFTLSASNFIYDLIARDKRATYLSVHNVLASIGIFGGAMLGGYLGVVMPTQMALAGITISWLSPLLGVFVISTLARALVVVFLLPKIREVRKVRPISFTDPRNTCQCSGGLDLRYHRSEAEDFGRRFETYLTRQPSTGYPLSVPGADV